MWKPIIIEYKRTDSHSLDQNKPPIILKYVFSERRRKRVSINNSNRLLFKSKNRRFNMAEEKNTTVVCLEYTLYKSICIVSRCSL